MPEKDIAEARRICGALLKVGIALQVLLLAQFFLSAIPHRRISTEQQKRTAQRHWGGDKPLAGLGGEGAAAVNSPGAASELQPPGTEEGGDEEEQGWPEGSRARAVELCMGAPHPWDPWTWREVSSFSSSPGGAPVKEAPATETAPQDGGGRALLVREAGHQQGAAGPAHSAAWKEKQRLKEREARQRARAEQAAAQALEDERTSVGPRNSWCERESRGAEHVLSMTAGERLLAACISKPHECRASPARLHRIASASLPGFRMLDDAIPCLFANGMSCPINATVRNKETGYTYDAVPFDLPLPDRDSASRFKSCAVVGNGASVMTSDRNGAAIDAHEAVFRFNDMLRLSCLDPDNPNAVLCQPEAPEAEGAANGTVARRRLAAEHVDVLVEKQDSRYRPFIGQRTTFRILNKKHALKLQALGRSAAPGRPRFRPAPSEAFLLWHHSSVAQGPALAREFPDNRLFFYSADLINWQVDAYSALRRDFYSLGLGPLPCYSALSSGVHGILLALRICDRVSLMGFSLDMSSVRGQVHFRPIFERPSEAHSWDFDVLLLRMLHLTGRVTVCSA